MRPFRSPRRAGQASPTMALAAAALFLAICAPALCRAEPPSSGSVRRTLSGDQVALHNLVGNLTVLRGEGSDVVAEITLSGPDAGRLRIEESPLRGRRTLRVIYPSDRIHVEELGSHSKSTFWVREDGTLDGKSGEGHKVVLSGKGGGLEAKADIRLYVPPGKDVDLFWGLGRGDVRNVNADLAIEGAAMGVTASEVKGSLRVSVGSGSVRVSRSSAAVNVETGSGNVDLAEMEGGNLSIETGSGTIRASDIDCSDLSLETGSGDIEAESIRASRASLETGSGSVVAFLTADIEAFSVESGSGNVQVSVPRTFGADVHMETGSGDIETAVPIEVRKRSRNEVTGTIGDGRGRLRLETGSGNITVRSASR